MLCISSVRIRNPYVYVYACVPRMYVNIYIRMYTSFVCMYIHVPRMYICVHRMYICVHRAYICVPRAYICVPRAYICVPRAYICVPRAYVGVASAQAEGNSGKARRMGRIVKQYEETIRDVKRGKDVDFAELPTPPGYPPIPVGGARQQGRSPQPPEKKPQEEQSQQTKVGLRATSEE